jgi:hypothetical protein
VRVDNDARLACLSDCAFGGRLSPIRRTNIELAKKASWIAANAANSGGIQHVDSQLASALEKRLVKPVAADRAPIAIVATSTRREIGGNRRILSHPSDITKLRPRHSLKRSSDAQLVKEHPAARGNTFTAYLLAWKSMLLDQGHAPAGLCEQYRHRRTRRSRTDHQHVRLRVHGHPQRTVKARGRR